jgi:hypothetical protein
MVTLDKPNGWITFDVSSEPNEEGDGLCVVIPPFFMFLVAFGVCMANNRLDSNPVYAYVLQILIAANHMSGKDTHVRGLRVLGPIEYVYFFLCHLPAVLSQSGTQMSSAKTTFNSNHHPSRCTKQSDRL